MLSLILSLTLTLKNTGAEKWVKASNTKTKTSRHISGICCKLADCRVIAEHVKSLNTGWEPHTGSSHSLPPAPYMIETGSIIDENLKTLCPYSLYSLSGQKHSPEDGFRWNKWMDYKWYEIKQSYTVAGQRSNNMAPLFHFFFRAKCFD